VKPAFDDSFTKAIYGTISASSKEETIDQEEQADQMGSFLDSIQDLW